MSGSKVHEMFLGIFGAWQCKLPYVSIWMEKLKISLYFTEESKSYFFGMKLWWVNTENPCCINAFQTVQGCGILCILMTEKNVIHVDENSQNSWACKNSLLPICKSCYKAGWVELDMQSNAALWTPSSPATHQRDTTTQCIIHAGISKNIFHVEKQVMKAPDTSTWHVHDRWSRNANSYLSLDRLFSGALRWEWTRRVRAARSRCATRAFLPPNRSHGTGPASPGRRFCSAEDPSSCSPGRSCYSG